MPITVIDKKNLQKISCWMNLTISHRFDILSIKDLPERDKKINKTNENST